MKALLDIYDKSNAMYGGRDYRSIAKKNGWTVVEDLVTASGCNRSVLGTMCNNDPVKYEAFVKKLHKKGALK